MLDQATLTCRLLRILLFSSSATQVCSEGGAKGKHKMYKLEKGYSQMNIHSRFHGNLTKHQRLPLDKPTNLPTSLSCYRDDKKVHTDIHVSFCSVQHLTFRLKDCFKQFSLSASVAGQHCQVMLKETDVVFYVLNLFRLISLYCSVSSKVYALY